MCVYVCVFMFKVAFSLPLATQKLNEETRKELGIFSQGKKNLTEACRFSEYVESIFMQMKKFYSVSGSNV